MFIAVDNDSGFYMENTEGETFENFAGRVVNKEIQTWEIDLAQLKFAAIIPHKFTVTRETD